MDSVDTRRDSWTQVLTRRTRARTPVFAGTDCRPDCPTWEIQQAAECITSTLRGAPGSPCPGSGTVATTLPPAATFRFVAFWPAVRLEEDSIPTDHLDADRDEPVLATDASRRRPLPPLVEAAARLALAYKRNQHGLRDKRPIGRFVARTARFLAAGRNRRYVEADMGGLRVVVPTADRTIARSVYTAGDWDPLLVGAAFDALDEFGQPYRGTTFLEVGANFGVYSLPSGEIVRLRTSRCL